MHSDIILISDSSVSGGLPSPLRLSDLVPLIIPLGRPRGTTVSGFLPGPRLDYMPPLYLQPVGTCQ